MAFLFVGIGGFLGSCLRYFFTLACKNLGTAIPLGTLLSNVLAGLLIGLILGLDRRTDLIAPRMKLFFTTGLLGGLSTFSTFSIETVDLFSAGNYSAAMGNVCLNLSLSLLGVVVGLALANALTAKLS